MTESGPVYNQVDQLQLEQGEYYRWNSYCRRDLAPPFGGALSRS
jgi:hypothetical protein